MNDFRYSPTGLALTRRFESRRLTAYQDQAGVWTIGYGHTGPDVAPGLTISEAHAETLLAADVAWAATCVNRSVVSAINQNQFDALVDFVFNLGAASLGNSTLLRLVNAGHFTTAPQEFLRWNKASGKVVPGLTRRRQAESMLFTTPVTTIG